jgi:hypothetical protein
MAYCGFRLGLQLTYFLHMSHLIRDHWEWPEFEVLKEILTLRVLLLTGRTVEQETAALMAQNQLTQLEVNA